MENEKYLSDVIAEADYQKDLIQKEKFKYKEALQEMTVAPFTNAQWYSERAKYALGLTEKMNVPQIVQSFGDAVEAARAGKMIYRRSWVGQFVFMQVPSVIEVSVIARMTSLPAPVKAEFLRRKRPLSYKNQFALVKDDNSIEGWNPSPADALALDWTVLE